MTEIWQIRRSAKPRTTEVAPDSGSCLYLGSAKPGARRRKRASGRGRQWSSKRLVRDESAEPW